MCSAPAPHQYHQVERDPSMLEQLGEEEYQRLIKEDEARYEERQLALEQRRHTAQKSQPPLLTKPPGRIWRLWRWVRRWMLTGR